MTEERSYLHRGLVFAGRVLRVFLFVFGLATSLWLFYSIIGVIVGILYFLLFRDNAWGRHGLFLATTVSLATIAAHKIWLRSPLWVSIYTLIASIIVYIVGNLIYRFYLSQTGHMVQISTRLGNLPKRGKSMIVILLALSPVLLWSSVNIDLGVMFDNYPQLLWVHAPTTVEVGDEFPVTVEAWDAFERLSAIYKGRVTFSIESYNLTTQNPLETSNAVLPTAYTFTGQDWGSDVAYLIQDGRDNGLHTFTVRIDTPGFHYLLVEDSLTENVYYSNPIIVRTSGSLEPRIYWGDTHSHSGLSDGTGTPEHHYFYARYVACLDFNALTDHAEIMMWFPGTLDVHEAATNTANDPGDFIALQGIEWTSDYNGHFTMIFSGDELMKDPVPSYIVLPEADMLWDALDAFTDSTGCRALAQPHHCTKLAYPQDWTRVNPKYVKTAEVTSVHGTFLYSHRHPLNYHGAIDPPPYPVNGTSITDAFNMGYRMTLYCGSDEHDGHPGHSLSHTRAFIGHQRPWSAWNTRNEHPYPGGITAVYATGLTRDEIFTGLENQRIYCCADHGRPYLSFSINGTTVGDGSTLQVNSGDAVREIVVTLVQDGAPAAMKHTSASVTSNWSPNWKADIEIIKNGELLVTIPVSTPLSTIRFYDSSPVTGTSYGFSRCIEIDGQYFINEFSDNPIDPSTLNTGGADYYLIRIVGENGRLTYAGPIWVEL